MKDILKEKLRIKVLSCVEIFPKINYMRIHVTEQNKIICIMSTRAGKVNPIPNVSAAYFNWKPNLHGNQFELFKYSSTDKEYIIKSIFKSIVKGLNATGSKGNISLFIMDRFYAFYYENYFWRYSMCALLSRKAIWIQTGRRCSVVFPLDSPTGGLFIVWVVCGLGCANPQEKPSLVHVHG